MRKIERREKRDRIRKDERNGMREREKDVRKERGKHTHGNTNAVFTKASNFNITEIQMAHNTTLENSEQNESPLIKGTEEEQGETR